MSKVLVIGASENPNRYSNKAVRRLVQHGHDVTGVGRSDGKIGDVKIHGGRPHFDEIDTLTLYLNPQVQEIFKDYIISLAPKRIIFNPGTENKEWYKELEAAGIKIEEACTLVLLSTGQF